MNFQYNDGGKRISLSDYGKTGMTNKERFIQAVNRIREINEHTVQVTRQDRAVAKAEYLAALDALHKSGEMITNYWQGLD